MGKEFEINVCICTYLRSKYLEECLESLLDQMSPPKTIFSITVIDNDINQSAKSLVSHFQVQNKVTIHYFCEKSRGIPFARNRALDESLKLGVDYIAFIDDDERASSDWLSTLCACLYSYPNPVVIHGRVVPEFPEGTSKHMCDLLFTKKNRQTGTQLQTCATDNVIFPSLVVSKFGLYFDTSNPLSGGTDTKFFLEVNERGIPIYECAEAIVFETVFSSRLKLSWIMSRKYRSGITTAWRRSKEGHSRTILALKTSIDILLRTFLIPIFTLFLLRVPRNKQLLKFARSTGILAGIFGHKVNSYAKVDV